MTGRAAAPEPILDESFDGRTLAPLRSAVLACVTAAGMPEPRATDVMLTAHELAANAVHHAGSGRARLWAGHGVLTCRVEDAGMPVRDGRARPGAGDPDGAAGGPTIDRTDPWSYQAGHGLWVARKAADELIVVSGPDGTRVTAVFAFPTDRLPADVT